MSAAAGEADDVVTREDAPAVASLMVLRAVFTYEKAAGGVIEPT